MGHTLDAPHRDEVIARAQMFLTRSDRTAKILKITQVHTA